MKVNLDSVRSEIETYIREQGLLVFRGFSRHSHDWGLSPVEWDTVQYPDPRAFLDIARELKIKLVVLNHRQFSADIIDDALESLADNGYDVEDRRDIERRLREMSVYDGFTCAVEISFDYEDNLYLFDLQADWFRELNSLLDQISFGSDDSEDDEDDPLGGYYSKN